ncbi:MAG: prepilin-type N-terminal cleavage/methylation domain-containing protein [Planctomycetales bacterium]
MTRRRPALGIAQGTARRGVRGLALPTVPRAFTLFEMLLVLAVLTVVAGLTYPSVSALFAHHQLQQGAEMVAIRFSSARVYAVETGLTYQFRFEPNGRRFLVVPFDPEPDSPSTGTASGATNSGSAPVSQRAMRKVGMLPSVCQFEAGSNVQDQGNPIPEDWLSGLPDAADYSGASWSAPILFHPDGTAANAEVTIRNSKNKQGVLLTLRGLTGAVAVTDIEDQR